MLQASSAPMAIGLTNTLGSVARTTKRVPRAAFEHFGRVLRAWVDDVHDGNQTAAAKQLGVTQGHISAMILGNRGPGLNTLILMREKTGKSIDEMLGLGPPPAEELAARLQASFDLEVARFRADAKKTLEQAQYTQRRRHARGEGHLSNLVDVHGKRFQRLRRDLASRREVVAGRVQRLVRPDRRPALKH